MYRASTPKQSFLCDVNPDETFKTILITYAQNGEVVLEKDKDDLTFDTTTDCKGETVYEAYFRLTQEESNLFDAASKVSVQVRALTYEGEAVVFDKEILTVLDVLNDEVLT